MFEIKDLSMIYDMDKEDKLYALSSVDLKLPDTGLVGIVGPSGSGKSTLMYCLSTLKKPTEGKIIYNGEDIVLTGDKKREELRRKEFGFVFQKHYLVPYLSALDNVIVAAGKSENGKELSAKAKDAMAKLGLKDRDMGKRPSKLSGGQCQRVAVARAMINSPKVLFADEPTASLDHNNSYALMKILKDYSKDRLVVVITHDRSVLRDADMTVEVWDGKISSVTEGAPL